MELTLVIVALCAAVGFITIIRLSKENKEIKSLEKSRTASLKNAERTVEKNKHLIKFYQKEHEKLLDRIVDLENNNEFLFNNLTPTKRKLARPDNQN